MQRIKPNKGPRHLPITQSYPHFILVQKSISRRPSYLVLSKEEAEIAHTDRTFKLPAEKKIWLGNPKLNDA